MTAIHKQHLEGLIFDLDGTLVDTAPDLMAATNHVLATMDRPPINDAQLRQFVGHGALMLIKRGLEATGGLPDEAEIKRLHGVFLDYYGKNIAVHSRLFDGLLPLLDKATDAGLKLGVCTNKVEGLSHKLLNEIGLAKYFSALVGGDTLPEMKPLPAPYIECARRMGVAAKHTVMFGDSETDIKTAKNVGVPVIAVTFGYTPNHVSTYAPNHVIEHYDAAWSLLENHA